MGHGRWYCCPLFENIICDGDPAQPVSRSGALKTGGTYWYYYKVNDLIERFDSMMPSTSNCPLLPGQKTNVLRVPAQCPEETPGERHVSLPGMSLDPKGRQSTFSSRCSKRRRTLSKRSGEPAVTFDKNRPSPGPESLHRLQTAAASLHILRALGHVLNTKEHAMTGRPLSAPSGAASNATDAGNARRAPESRCRSGRMPSPTAATSPARNHFRTAAGHRDIELLRTFSNPFSRHPDNRKEGRHVLGYQSPKRKSSSSNHRPSTYHGTTSTELQTRQPIRPDSAPSSLETPSPVPAAQTKRGSWCTGVRNLRLRVACAQLRAKQDEIVDSPTDNTPPEDVAKPLGRISEEADALRPVTTEEPALKRYQTEAVPIRSAEATVAGTPETASPSPKSDFWGSPFRRSLRDHLSTPGTEYDGSSKSRASRLYSLANSRDGLGLAINDGSLGSQETIRPSQKPISPHDYAPALAVQEPARYFQYVAEPATNLDRNDMTNADDIDTIDDFSFLGSAIT